MAWIIGVLTFVLLLDCLLLVLLVLIQLPKKEAGLGTAFGGAATDALFGAGSGNALTKMTKVSCGVFFALTLCLSVLNAQNKKASQSILDRTLMQAPPVPEMPVESETPAPVAPVNPLTIATNLEILPNASPADGSVPAETEVPPTEAPENPDN